MSSNAFEKTPKDIITKLTTFMFSYFNLFQILNAFKYQLTSRQG